MVGERVWRRSVGAGHPSTEKDFIHWCLELLVHDDNKKHLVSFTTAFKFSADNVPYLPSWGYTTAKEHLPHPLIHYWGLGTVYGKDSKSSIEYGHHVRLNKQGNYLENKNIHLFWIYV